MNSNKVDFTKTEKDGIDTLMKNISKPLVSLGIDSHDIAKISVELIDIFFRSSTCDLKIRTTHVCKYGVKKAA